MSNQTRERPILFNTEMVRAILDGEKTVTRRPIKPQYAEQTGGIKIPLDDFAKDCDIADFSPYSVGDRLWVRETWCQLWHLDDRDRPLEGTEKYYYAADGYNPTPFNHFPDENGFSGGRDRPRWKPSIHMPREAARLFLRVTDVRAERLQDITDKDAKKEGVICREEDHDCELAKVFPTASIAAFSRLWDSTVEKSELNRYGWAANPWVWVIEYEREEQP